MISVGFEPWHYVPSCFTYSKKEFDCLNSFAFVILSFFINNKSDFCFELPTSVGFLFISLGVMMEISKTKQHFQT